VISGHGTVVIKGWVLFASRCPSMIQASFSRSCSGLKTERQSTCSCVATGGQWQTGEGLGATRRGAATSRHQEGWIRDVLKGSPGKRADRLVIAVQMQKQSYN